MQLQHYYSSMNMGHPRGAARSPMNNRKLSRDRDRSRSDPVSSDGNVYQVHFKRAHRNFLLAPSAPRNLSPGDFVKVEADRGEDLGVVIARIPVLEFDEAVPTAGYRGRGFSSGQSEKKLVLRRASMTEREMLLDKVYHIIHIYIHTREISLSVALHRRCICTLTKSLYICFAYRCGMRREPSW